ncbi:phosphoglycerate mutase [Luteimonas sp. A478]
MPAVTYLLPAAEAFGAQRLGQDGAAHLGRADRLPPADAGRRPQLLRHFSLLPRQWPIAALSRQADAGDAAGAAWLRADPAWVRPDINGARLLACGQDLQLSADDTAALVKALRPVFGDAGCPIDAPHPSRWYLRLPAGASLPESVPPAEALGTDLGEHLHGEGTIPRRWRALLSEAQIILHNHPVNAERAERGLTPVNSLWFWGGGVLPDQVKTAHAAVMTAEEELQALSLAADARVAELPPAFDPDSPATLVDLRALRDLRLFADVWLMPALKAIASSRLTGLTLDLEDGTGYRFGRRQRLRFWRGARPSLAQ